ncbi:hypothetical protein CI102_15175 [Trichoderma harzianum]|nr:hypothetical protein CI102_15175 [Trichoderma harzianum]
MSVYRKEVSSYSSCPESRAVIAITTCLPLFLVSRVAGFSAKRWKEYSAIFHIQIIVADWRRLHPPHECVPQGSLSSWSSGHRGNSNSTIVRHANVCGGFSSIQYLRLKRFGEHFVLGKN